MKPIITFLFSFTSALYPFSKCQDPSLSAKFFGLTGYDDYENPGISGFSLSAASYWCSFNSGVMADPQGEEELKDVLNVYRECYGGISPQGAWLASFNGVESPFGCGWLIQGNGDLVAHSNCSDATFRAPTICRYISN